jgi:hypothetical protein
MTGDHGNSFTQQNGKDVPAARDRLTAASLARLNAPDPATFQHDARFALATLPALTTCPDQIKQLQPSSDQCSVFRRAWHGKIHSSLGGRKAYLNFEVKDRDRRRRRYFVPFLTSKFRYARVSRATNGKVGPRAALPSERRPD